MSGRREGPKGGEQRQRSKRKERRERGGRKEKEGDRAKSDEDSRCSFLLSLSHSSPAAIESSVGKKPDSPSVVVVSVVQFVKRKRKRKRKVRSS